MNRPTKSPSSTPLRRNGTKGCPPSPQMEQGRPLLSPNGATERSHGWSRRFADATRGERSIDESRPGGAEGLRIVRGGCLGAAAPGASDRNLRLSLITRRWLAAAAWTGFGRPRTLQQDAEGVVEFHHGQKLVVRSPNEHVLEELGHIDTPLRHVRWLTVDACAGLSLQLSAGRRDLGPPCIVPAMKLSERGRTNIFRMLDRDDFDFVNRDQAPVLVKKKPGGSLGRDSSDRISHNLVWAKDAVQAQPCVDKVPKSPIPLHCRMDPSAIGDGDPICIRERHRADDGGGPRFVLRIASVARRARWNCHCLHAIRERPWQQAFGRRVIGCICGTTAIHARERVEQRQRWQPLTRVHCLNGIRVVVVPPPRSLPTPGIPRSHRNPRQFRPLLRPAGAGSPTGAPVHRSRRRSAAAATHGYNPRPRHGQSHRAISNLRIETASPVRHRSNPADGVQSLRIQVPSSSPCSPCSLCLVPPC